MVTAALTLALGAYGLTVVHRLETFEPKFNRTDYSHVVVAGAWRLPNKTLSATFCEARRPRRRARRTVQRNAGLHGWSGRLASGEEIQHVRRPDPPRGQVAHDAPERHRDGARRARRDVDSRGLVAVPSGDGASCTFKELSYECRGTSPPHCRIRGTTGAAAASSRASTGRRPASSGCRTRARCGESARGPRTSFRDTLRSGETRATPAASTSRRGE